MREFHGSRSSVPMHIPNEHKNEMAKKSTVVSRELGQLSGVLLIHIYATHAYRSPLASSGGMRQS